MTQVPRGPENLYCPDWKKPMSKVCHTCPLWVHIRGKNPNTGEDVDRWNCAKAWTPMLLIENSQMQRQTGAAVESFRNEMVRLNNIGLVAQMTGETKLLDS
jgi:hypothetical protein